MYGLGLGVLEVMVSCFGLRVLTGFGGGQWVTDRSFGVLETCVT